MKKIFYLLLFIMLLLINDHVFAMEKPKIYLFHLDGCPHCAEAREYIRAHLQEEFKDLELVQYEVNEYGEFLDQIQSVNGYFSYSVPYIMIGNYVVVGFNSDIKEQLHEATSNYIKADVELNVPELVKDGTLTSQNYSSMMEEYNKKMASNLEKYEEPSSDTPVLDDDLTITKTPINYFVPIMAIVFVLVLGAFIIYKKEESH